MGMIYRMIHDNGDTKIFIKVQVIKKRLKAKLLEDTFSKM